LIAAALNSDVPINIAQQVGFGIIAALMVWGAFRVVSTRDIVHAALWLVLVLAGVAAQFILLGAEFVALTQVLVYIGAVVVLFLFGIMLTKAPIGGDAHMTGKGWMVGAFTAVLLFGVLTFSLVDTFGRDRLPADTRVSLRPAAVSQFEADTGIATANLSEEQLIAKVKDLDAPAEDEKAYLATAEQIAQVDGPLDSNVGAVSDSIFSGYLIPFEVVSVLLTAALIGAIVLARKE